MPGPAGPSSRLSSVDEPSPAPHLVGVSPSQPRRYQTFFAELKRRQVFKAAAVYGGVAFVVMQAADFLVPALRLPEAGATAIALLGVLGFPIALALAWAFELTSEGVQREIPAAAGELEAIVAAPMARRWPAGIFALAGILLLLGGGWWVLLRDAGPAKAENLEPVAALAAVAPKSIAVLPLVNMNQDPETEWFSDGITEDIITQLTKIRDLKVISRTTVMRYKGEQEKTLREIGEELGVASLVEGSVRQQGDRVRITAQLIDAATDEHLWAETYDRQMTDVFAIQSDVAQKIAAALEATLSPEERARIDAEPTENLEAYNLYLKGRYFWNQRTQGALWRAVENFESAIAADSGYALAYAGLADAYQILALSVYSGGPPTELVPRAKDAILRALELDPELAEAHATLAFIRCWFDRDWSAAGRAFERMVELGPNYATGREYYSLYLAALGRHEEAFAEARRSRELDPLSPIINAVVGFDFHMARRHDDAIRAFDRTLEIEPGFWFALIFSADAHAAKQMIDEAVELAERAVTNSSRAPFALGILARIYGQAGRRDDALRVLAELDRRSETEYVSPFHQALAYVGLGQKDEAFELLHRTVDERDFTIAMLNEWWIFDPLRSDPRFDELVRMIVLEPR